MDVQESTLVMIKPDATQRKLVELIRQELEGKFLAFREVGQANFRLPIVQEFYRWDTIRCPDTVQEYLCVNPIPLWIVRGSNAVERAMEVKWRLRRTMCDGSHRNLMHCSSSIENFAWECTVLRKYGMIPAAVGGL